MLTQALLNGLIAASYYLLAALGFSLIYSTSRFFHFAHGAIITLGAYLTYSLHYWLGLPFMIAAILSVLCCGICGLLLNQLVYNKLLSKGAGALVLMLASFGLYVVLENIIAVIWGTATLGLGLYISDPLCRWNACLTWIHLLTISVSVISWVALAAFLSKSRFGLLIRAVSQSRQLSIASGIRTRDIVNMTFFIGSMLAAVAGILLAADVGMTPTMGLHMLMMGVIVSVVGGIGSLKGLMVASLFVGLVRHLSIFFIGSQWQDTIVFILLLLSLLILPSGFKAYKITLEA